MSKDEGINYISIAFNEGKKVLFGQGKAWFSLAKTTSSLWSVLGFSSYPNLRWAALPAPGLCTCGRSPGTQAHDSAIIFTDQLIKSIYSTISKYHLIVSHQSKELSREFSHLESLRFWVTSSRLKVKSALPPRTRGFAGDRSGQGRSWCVTREQATLVYREICKATTHAQRLTLRPKWKLKMFA